MHKPNENEARFESRLAAEDGARSHGEDLRATARLVVDATVGVMDVVAEMQRALSPPVVSQVQSLANKILRETTRRVGEGIDTALETAAPLFGVSQAGPAQEAMLAALNGVVGDRLEANGSPLALDMSLRPPLDEHRQGTLILLIHGSSMNDRQWSVPSQDARNTRHDHGRALLADLEGDVTLAYLRYNTGLHIRENGERLASLLNDVSEGFSDIVLVGYSMGGLLARSALAVAESSSSSWFSRVRVLVTMGTPHLGAPLERIGNFVDLALEAFPQTAALAAVGKIRSAGVTDLRFGTVLELASDRFDRNEKPASVPLPAHVYCVAIAGTRTQHIQDSGSAADDNLVPVASAFGEASEPGRTLAFDERVLCANTNHLQLLGSRQAYDTLLAACRRKGR